MSTHVNIRVAKANLSKLIERAQSGEDIIITKCGKPAVKLTAIGSGQKRILGSAAGQIVFHEGWESSMGPKELKEFLGS